TALSLSGKESRALQGRSGIWVKLSALHPGYEGRNRQDVTTRLYKRLHPIMQAAKERGIPVTIDAEEAHRLEISLELLTMLCRDGAFAGFDGIGIAVQAYQKRAGAVIEYVAALAESTRRQIPVRLVKGAYW